MSNILISIDLQEDYSKQAQYVINKLSTEEGNSFISSFDKFIYIIDETNWTIEDNVDENGIWLWNDIYLDYDEDTWEENYNNKYFYWLLVDEKIIKSYWFFRDLMDEWWSNDSLIQLWQLLINNNLYTIYDLKDLNQDNMIFQKFLNIIENENWWEVSDLKYISFNLPNSKLINNLKNEIWINDKIVLIGWWENECLKELELLLKMLWYLNIFKENKYIF